MGKCKTHGKAAPFQSEILLLDFNIFLRLFGSYLRVNRVPQQVIACVPRKCMPFLNRKQTKKKTIGKHLLLHFLSTYVSLLFGNLKKAFSGKEECIFFCFISHEAL